MNAPDPKTILAGELAFRTALTAAQNRGGPVAEIDAIATRPPEAPKLITGESFSRMTLGIQRLLQKRAAMPDTMASAEIVLFFVRGPAALAALNQYREEEQSWDTPESRTAYEELISEVDALTDATDRVDARTMLRVSEWIGSELSRFTSLAAGDDKSKPGKAAAGSAGSRVGWWLRAVDGIICAYPAPAGASDLTAWAVWQFPLNDYLALQPASLERAGVELEEHYAVKEARAARTKAKEKAKAAAPPAREDGPQS